MNRLRPRQQIDRRRILGAAAATLLSGCDRLSEPASRGSQRFQVAGPSMAPTLYGNRTRARCHNCSVVIPVQHEFAEHVSPGFRFLCWHCGASVPLEGGAQLAADIVETQPVRPGDLRLGDMVAVLHDQRLRVKRLFALPRSTVSLRGNRLRVDGARLNDRAIRPISTVPVDIDSLRRTSRWHSTSQTTGWERSHEHRWLNPGGSDGWLRYIHRSVHDHNLEAAIRDDYPGNVSLNRQLHPAERLQLSIEVACDGQGIIEVAAWCGGELLSSRFQVNRRRNVIWNPKPTRDVDPLATDRDGRLPERRGDIASAQLSPTRPLAVRVLGGRNWQMANLRIKRELDYRLGRRQAHDPYPIRLRDDECFVVGDNVPISIDSRHWGPLPIERVVGRVRRIDDDVRG